LVKVLAVQVAEQVGLAQADRVEQTAHCGFPVVGMGLAGTMGVVVLLVMGQQAVAGVHFAMLTT